MKQMLVDQGKRIAIYDDVFDFKFRQKVYEFCNNSKFTIGWADSVIIENQKHRYLHSIWSEEDLERLGIIEKIKKSPVGQELENYQLEKCILNLSTPSDCNFQHTHAQNKIILYYVNLDWKDGWHGETLFYDESLKNIVFASPYIPGRITVFDGSIPHTIRPQSSDASNYRFTLALLYNKKLCDFPWPTKNVYEMS
jgi:hypothetical protein